VKHQPTFKKKKASKLYLDQSALLCWRYPGKLPAAWLAVCTPDVEPRARDSCSAWEWLRKAWALQYLIKIPHLGAVYYGSANLCVVLFIFFSFFFPALLSDVLHAISEAPHGLLLLDTDN